MFSTKSFPGFMSFHLSLVFKGKKGIWIHLHHQFHSQERTLSILRLFYSVIVHFTLSERILNEDSQRSHHKRANFFSHRRHLLSPHLFCMTRP